jgi:hypothetical protein
MVSAILATLLIFAILSCLKEENAREHRKIIQRDVPRELLLPRHYKSFVEIEKQLLTASDDSQRADWESARIKLRADQLRVVREYVRGLREDFERGDRIFSIVIGRSPNGEILKQLEWHRLRIEFPYYFSLAVVRSRLCTDRVSPRELQRLTHAVAMMAYEVRSMLTVLENGGHGKFVESVLREY